MKLCLPVLAVAFAGAMVLAALLLYVEHSPAAHATHVPVEVAIDVDVAGNEANTLGPTESCNATPLAVGETGEVDVVVRGVPPVELVSDHPFEETITHGISGYGFDLLFDPAV